ncbi:hypothetical protein like AT5G67390 [Hibiscus trionum]|uniref:Uncharacterized protein n=1 Tax=Hibiscus trionum TaxID=183268 RepID=A0A9W7IGA7_HIBTR|nr:hypothetical protein like AT5G67390 [Hibiscus trionum]
MGKLFIPSDKESMRMAMLKHEETFKQQVYELHRLYRIQKALMEHIRPNRARRLDSEHQADCGNGILEVIDESDIELTLGPPAKKHGISTPPRTSDSRPSFSSSSAESCHMTIEYRNGGKINLEQELRKERLRQAPWIFQVLTMNMT